MKRLSRLLHRKRFPNLDKRQRFAIQTFILTVGLLITQLIWQDYRFIMVGILSIASYFLTRWSLIEDVKGIEWILLFILPVLFTACVSLFYFLLPGRWVWRLAIITIFAIGTYAILLVENIYNVAAVRSIQLLRAAHSVGFLLSLTVIFLFANIVYSLRLSFWLNMLFFFIFSYIMAFQSLWTIKLEEKITSDVVIYSFVVAVGVGELGLVLSFLPVMIGSYSLLLSATYYSLVGVIQQHLLGRLFRNNIREYILVFIFSLILTLVTIRWR